MAGITLLALGAARAFAGDPPLLIAEADLVHPAAEALAALQPYDTPVMAAADFDAWPGMTDTAPAGGEPAAALTVDEEQAPQDPSRQWPRFQASALQWVQQGSAGVLRVAEFLVGGGDSGWQLMVDPTGEDEYQLRWEARFR